MHPPSDFLLIERINQCPKLASLRSINDTLRSLLESEDSFLAQIAEVIRLDPSLTTRVLDLVNSIFFGSKDNKRISGVEEASIFLGLNRIRELLFATPVIEEILELGKNAPSFPWEEFWKHSIGTAILTRELLSVLDISYEEEADYVAGLLHNLGILILAITFPELFKKIYLKKYDSTDEIIDEENAKIGWGHAKIGAYYLWNHHISDEIVDAIHWHDQPKQSKESPKLAAAIQVSQAIVSELGFTGLNKCKKPESGSYQKLEGWEMLTEGHDDPDELITSINEASGRLNQSLNGIF
ncbi:HDOD domain-containing protein [Opitutales bacterium]|jgi:HD-like signal output (HDOD) protein|uniref:HDOD domain-containing protein n=1 Tax=Candidatus Chordibacter forsetii TaxID=3381758 RepID=UPI0023114FFB|nr:HDOD domain-containing protein [Opitutales bacterium]MDA8805752.1 HDOD domain-containing protein [Opitutales bacterium]MDC3284381.1 HDOD domain-containing protein [Opitutales bacterium]